MKTNSTFNLCLVRLKYRWPLILVYLLSSIFNCSAQCPPNIDFEKGDFSGWTTYIGKIFLADGSVVVNASPQIPQNHAILSALTDTGFDRYGGFPLVCPNGSGYSVKLGNNQSGAEAESISYTFTIPQNAPNFSLIYNYAVVLEDPGHTASEQPRLRIEVINLTDSIVNPCTSFDFVSTASLPGFKVSPFGTPGAPVIYKDWSAAFIKLDGNAGKTFKISFTSTDCSRGGHFGYAYLDVNVGCSSILPGSVYCVDDQFIKIEGPPGFQNYNWYNSLNENVGNFQDLTLSPLPLGGDSLYVVLTPYDGYGCLDVLRVYLSDTLTIQANAGPDTVFCLNPKIRLGAAPVTRQIYSWSPSIGLTNPAVANPFASPMGNVQYILNVENLGGGCNSADTVNLVQRCGVVDLYVPGAFTPNGDGVNDWLRPVLYGFSKVNYFRIYNRFGQLIYQASSDLPGWDGNIKNKPAGTQTVVWVIEAVNAFGETVKRRGTSLLIR